MNQRDLITQIAEFTVEKETDSIIYWRLRRAKAKLFEAIIDICQSPSDVPAIIQASIQSEEKIARVLQRASRAHASAEGSSVLTNPTNRFLPERIRLRAMSTMIIKPWRVGDSIQWHEKSAVHAKYSKIILNALDEGTDHEKYIVLVLVKDMIQSTLPFTNSKPRVIIAKSIEPVLANILAILPNALNQEAEKQLVAQECMAISVQVFQGLAVQVGVSWCAQFVDIMMNVITSSKTAFIESMKGSEPNQTVLAKFVNVLQMILTSESVSFKRRLDRKSVV